MGAPTITIAHVDIGQEERSAADRVLRSGRLIQGLEVEAFERDLARDLSGTSYAIAVSSGTTALELALLAMDLEDGDEIVTTPFTFVATVNAVLRAGATVRSPTSAMISTSIRWRSRRP